MRYQLKALRWVKNFEVVATNKGLFLSFPFISILSTQKKLEKLNQEELGNIKVSSVFKRSEDRLKTPSLQTLRLTETSLYVSEASTLVDRI